jgi:hypothetical protein
MGGAERRLLLEECTVRCRAVEMTRTATAAMGCCTVW